VKSNEARYRSIFFLPSLGLLLRTSRHFSYTVTTLNASLLLQGCSREHGSWRIWLALNYSPSHRTRGKIGSDGVLSGWVLFLVWNVNQSGLQPLHQDLRHEGRAAKDLPVATICECNADSRIVRPCRGRSESMIPLLKLSLCECHALSIA
jgi:hypothetical protein